MWVGRDTLSYKAPGCSPCPRPGRVQCCGHERITPHLRRRAAARHHPRLPDQRRSARRGPRADRRPAAGLVAARLSGGRLRLGRDPRAARGQGDRRRARPSRLRALIVARRGRGLPRAAHRARPRGVDRVDDRHGWFSRRAPRPSGRARLGRCGGVEPRRCATRPAGAADDPQLAASGDLPARTAS